MDVFIISVMVSLLFSALLRVFLLFPNLTLFLITETKIKFMRNLRKNLILIELQDFLGDFLGVGAFGVKSTILSSKILDLGTDGCSTGVGFTPVASVSESLFKSIAIVLSSVDCSLLLSNK